MSKKTPSSAFYERQVFGIHDADDAEIHRQQAEVAHRLRAGRPTARLLDIGSGAGVGADLIAKRLQAETTICIDLSTDALRQVVLKGMEPLVASAEGALLPLADGSIDVAILDEVIEHLVDPDSILDEIRRVLTPDGMLLLSTPNLAAWFNRAMLVAGMQPAFSEVSLRGVFGRPGTDIVGHLRLFTRRALHGLLEARGFRIVSSTGTTFPGLPRLAQPIDRLLTRVPSAAAGLVVAAVPA